MKSVQNYGNISNVKINSPKKSMDYSVEELDKSGMGQI